MGRRSKFSNWQGDAYTGVAEVGRVKSTINLMVTVPITIILVLVSVYMFMNPEEVREGAIKSCEEDQKRLKDIPLWDRTQDQINKLNENCEDEPGGIFWGTMLLILAIIISIAAYFNYKMSKTSKSYAAFQGGMAISNALSPRRRYY